MILEREQIYDFFKHLDFVAKEIAAIKGYDLGCVYFVNYDYCLDSKKFCIHFEDRKDDFYDFDIEFDSVWLTYDVAILDQKFEEFREQIRKEKLEQEKLLSERNEKKQKLAEENMINSSIQILKTRGYEVIKK